MSDADTRPSIPLLFMERGVDPRQASVPFPGWETIRAEVEKLPANKDYQRLAASGRLPYPASQLFLPYDNPDQLAPNPLDRDHVQLTPSVQRYLRHVHTSIRGNPDVDGVANSFLIESVMRTVWEAYGRRVFILDPATYDGLAQSDLPPIPLDEVAIPVPAFYLYLPHGPFTLEAGGREQPIEGAFVLIDRESPGLGTPITIELLAVGATHSAANHTLTSYSRFEADTTVADAAERLVGLSGDVAETSATGMQDVMRSVLGLLVYLMSEHPIVEPVQPRTPPGEGGARRRRAGRGRRPTVAAARSRIGFLKVGGARDMEGTGYDPQDRYSIQKRFPVRGHFRNQAWGPGRQLRKLIWIRPHWRGPDFAETVNIHAQHVQPGEVRGGDATVGGPDTSV